MNQKHVSIYIHWPFCKSKCPYCDFNSYAAEEIDMDSWLKAYQCNLAYYSNHLADKKIKSIFFGGGTPSLAPTKIIDGIITKIAHISEMETDIEITLEANPTSVESEKFKTLRAIGINRISLGIQSFNDVQLKFLGREHSANEAKQAIQIAQKYFDNYSLDFIYALPNQNIQDWESELHEIAKYTLGHLSLYQLSIEKGTKFFQAYKNMEFIMPSDELSAEFYGFTEEFVSSQIGLERYEVSNYYKHTTNGKDYKCAHNVNYWKYGNYIGIGPGAHGRYSIKDKTYATTQYYNPNLWLEKSKSDNVSHYKITPLSKEEIYKEKIIMGMRLSDGIPKSLILNHKTDKVNFLIKAGILEENRDNIRASKKGVLLLNEIIKNFIDES